MGHVLEDSSCRRWRVDAELLELRLILGCSLEDCSDGQERGIAGLDGMGHP